MTNHTYLEMANHFRETNLEKEMQHCSLRIAKAEETLRDPSASKLAKTLAKYAFKYYRARFKVLTAIKKRLGVLQQCHVEKKRINANIDKERAAIMGQIKQIAKTPNGKKRIELLRKKLKELEQKRVKAVRSIQQKMEKLDREVDILNEKLDNFKEIYERAVDQAKKEHHR